MRFEAEVIDDLLQMNVRQVARKRGLSRNRIDGIQARAVARDLARRDLTRRQVVVLAYFFGITREAMMRRLEELRLVKAGTWDSLQAEGGIPDAQARQILGELAGIDAAQAEAGQPTTLRLSLLAAEA